MKSWNEGEADGRGRQGDLSLGGGGAPLHVFLPPDVASLPLRNTFLSAVNLIILPTAPLLSRPPVSPLVGIVKRTTDKVFASSTFGLFSPRGNKLASSAAATFSSFKTFHSHGTSSPVDPRARGVIRASGITENLSAVCRLSKDGWRLRLKQDQEDRPKTKQDHLRNGTFGRRPPSARASLCGTEFV